MECHIGTRWWVESSAPEKFVVVGYCRIFTEGLGFLTFQAKMELWVFIFFFLKEKNSCIPVNQVRQSLFTPVEEIRTSLGDKVFSSGFAPTVVALMVLSESQGHPPDI